MEAGILHSPRWSAGKVVLTARILALGIGLRTQLCPRSSPQIGPFSGRHRVAQWEDQPPFRRFRAMRPGGVLDSTEIFKPPVGGRDSVKVKNETADFDDTAVAARRGNLAVSGRRPGASLPLIR